MLFGMRLESRKHIGSPTGQQAYAIIFTEKKKKKKCRDIICPISNPLQLMYKVVIGFIIEIASKGPICDVSPIIS